MNSLMDIRQLIDQCNSLIKIVDSVSYYANNQHFVRSSSLKRIIPDSSSQLLSVKIKLDRELLDSILKDLST